MAPSDSGSSSSGAATTSPATAQPAARPSPKEFVSISDLKDVHFDFDKYDIRPPDAKVLDANATWLKSNPEHLVLIEGHCDERGTNEYNRPSCTQKSEECWAKNRRAHFLVKPR
jgi:peptidoglycan-associated lipoprotein